MRRGRGKKGDGEVGGREKGGHKTEQGNHGVW